MIRIRTFGNRCLSAIGGENRWSRFAGWVQLSAEAAWPPRNTTSATLCAGYHAVIFWSSIWLFKSQRWYDNRHLFFSKERHKKNYHRYQNGIKNKKVSEFWMFILYQRRSWLLKWLPVRFTHNGDFLQWIWCLYPIQSLPLLLMIWRCDELGPISPVTLSSGMD